MLVASLPLHAGDGVTIWENTFHRPLPGAGYQSVLAARELADGTTLAVVQDNSGITALQYDHSGNLLHSATFNPVYGPQVVAIDPFGGVVIAAEAFEDFLHATDIWLMKYDGLTGAALWPSGTTFGSGNHADDAPIALFLDPAGDAVLWSSNDVGNSCILSKYSGGNGQPVWGPVIAAAGGLSSVAQVDGSGDAYVAFQTGSAFSLIKYSGSGGAIVWQDSESGHNLVPVSLGFDNSGNLVVVGGSSSFAGSFEADKYAGATGQRIWGPAVWTPPTGNYGTTPDAAAVGSDGSVVIFGHTGSNSQTSEELLKFRGADGALLWGPLPNSDPMESPFGSALTLAGNGDAILNVRVPTGESTGDLKMWRYDGNTGSIVWGPQTVVNGSNSTPFVASNGRVFDGIGVWNGSDEDAVILERDGATGVPAWGPLTFTGAAAGAVQLWDVASSPDGNVVVTGQVEAPDGTAAWATLKYERNTGNILWGPMYFSTGIGANTFSPWRVRTDTAGDVLVGGSTSNGISVVKYSGSTGAQLWSTSAAPAANVYAFALDSSGNAIASGYQYGATVDVATVKFSGASGAVLWGPIVYDSGFDDFPDFVAADPSGDVILAGHSGVIGPPGFLIKYAAADGSVVWGPVTQTDYSTWLAVDTAGDIFRESYPTSNSIITTTKFSGATGAVLWGPTMVGAPGSGFGAALAIDATNDVFVTGGLWNGQSYDYAVIKYHGADGSVLWGPVTYDSGEEDSPYFVVVDGSGNPVVTGITYLSSGEFQTATLSYDGATGALRWGPVGRNIARDSVNGLAASGSTVFVGATRGDVGYIVDAIDTTLGIATLPGALPAVSCGHAVDIPLGAINGTPPYAWSIVGGGLPPAVVLVGSGDIIGTPAEEGTYAFEVQVQDSALATVTRGFTLTVGPGGPLVPVAVTRDPATCQLTLSVSGSYAGYDWLPGGQSTPTLTVDPTEPTPYGVILNDGSTCAVRGAVAIVPFDPSCLSPTLASISPTSGPDSGTPVVVAGAKFDPSAALSIGGQPATGVVFQNASTLDANTPALPPGTVADVLVVNPDGRYAMLLRSFASDFLDVSSSNPFYADIMKVLRAGITAGCGSGNYCSMNSVSRAQMAVFLLKAEHGFFHVPPPCTGVFTDVPCPGGFAVNWIEELAAEGITSGCGGSDYCPDGVVTRAQMAVFLLKAEHGSSYMPPPCTGVFGDVPCPGPVTDWIEQLANEGITAGCGGGNYCPASPNTRGQMSVFLARTFGLP